MSLKLKLTMVGLFLIGLLSIFLLEPKAQGIPASKPSEYLGNCIINFTWLQEQKALTDQVNLGLQAQIAELKKKCGKACEDKPAN